MEDVFEIGPHSSGAAYIERLKVALEDSQTRARRPRPGEKLISRDQFLGLGEPQKETIKKTDLNTPAKKWMTAKGWKWDRVDYYDARTTRSHDLLGMFDYLAFTPEGETVGVQITAASSISARRKKILDEPRFQWIKNHWRVVILGFSKEGTKWATKETWLT